MLKAAGGLGRERLKCGWLAEVLSRNEMCVVFLLRFLSTYSGRLVLPVAWHL